MQRQAFASFLTVAAHVPGQYATYAGHQLLPAPLFNQYEEYQCRYQVRFFLLWTNALSILHLLCTIPYFLACSWVHVCILKPKFIGNGIAPYHAQVENVTDECNAVMGQMDNLTSLIDPFVPCGCVWHCGLSVAVTRAVFLLVTRWTFLFALRTAVTRRLLPAETNGTRC